MNIISREDLFKERMRNAREGDLLTTLFNLANEMEIAYGEELQNAFSFAAIEYFKTTIKSNVRTEDVYTRIKNVFYVVELYLRGGYGEEPCMGYEEFLKLIMDGKADELIKVSCEKFKIRINNLKNIISKSMSIIPSDMEFAYKHTKFLLKELYSDLTKCEKYPDLSDELSGYVAGKLHGCAKPEVVCESKGFIALEKTIYTLHNELYILSKIDSSCINKIAYLYTKHIGVNVSFNLFEKVINNHLFSFLYADEPETLTISEVDAKLLISEVKMGILSTDELVDMFIDKYNLEGEHADYMRKYGKYLQERVDALKDASYFGELFILNPPAA